MKKQKKRAISWLLCSALLAGQVLPASAYGNGKLYSQRPTDDTPSPLAVSQSAVNVQRSTPSGDRLEITNSNYTAAVDLGNAGTVEIMLNGSTTNPWNTLDAGMVPGTTQLSDKTAAVNAGDILKLSLDGIGSGGVSINGDISGQKSYFLLNDEIVCIGAGMTAENGTGSSILQTVVEAAPILTSGSPRNKLGLTYKGDGTANVGYSWVEKWLDSSGNLPETQAGNTGYKARNWLFASIKLYSSSPDSGYGYVFPQTLGTDNVWYQMEDIDGANKNFEIWLQHEDTYEYVIVPNSQYASFYGGSGAANKYVPKTQIIMNDPKVQAVADYENHIVAANFWEANANGVRVENNETGAIISNNPSSVMVEKNTTDKTLTISVAPLSTGITDNIELTLETKGVSVVSAPTGVTADFSNGKIHLTIEPSAFTGDKVAVAINTETVPDPENDPIENNFKNSVYEVDINVNPNNGAGMVMPKRTGEDDYYTTDYWETINKNRLPGTVNPANESDPPVKITTVSSWNGGSTGLDEFGVRGVKLEGGSIEGVQSYMMFQNQILCLGAGIKNNLSNDGNILVLENLKLRPDLGNYFSMGYDLKQVSYWTDPNTGVKVWDQVYDQITNSSNESKNHSWIYVTNINNGKNGTGYYFPREMKDKVGYSFANRSVNGVSRKYLEFWLNLGTATSYDYVIFPNIEAHGAVNNYYTKPDIEILSNTEEVQAAYQITDRTLAANFWTDKGGVIESNYHGKVTVQQKASLVMNIQNGIISLAVSDPEKTNTGTIEIEIDQKGYNIISADPGVTVDLTSDPNKIKLHIDVSAQTGENFKTEISIVPPALDPSLKHIELVRGQSASIEKPAEFTGNVTWQGAFLKLDGTTVNTSGYSKYKRELQGAEKEGDRVAGPASVSHIALTEGLTSGNCLITAKEMGNFYLIATEEGTGNQKIYTVQVNYMDPAKLPAATAQDFATLRENWLKSVIGSDLASSQAGQTALATIETTAKKFWDSYAYKGQEACGGIPWPDETTLTLEEYKNDAAAFRPAIQHVQAMARAYAAEGSIYYQDAALLKDIINLLDWLTTYCYTAKSQTDNWWTWEIGIPKDLIQTLILMYDSLTKEQIEKYAAPLKFFQPDPFHEGAAGNASTHAQGYRTSQGANLVDCSIIALGIGALLDDNESVYLAKLATAGQFVFQTVEDSTSLKDGGYASGFYPDGSYIDHSYVPYTGSYGIEFFKGGVNLADILKNSPWQYDTATIGNLEAFVLQGFAPSIYNGLMLDMLKGRAVSRSNNTNRTSGRDVMSQMLRLIDAVTPEAQAEFKNYIKNWLLTDTGYIDTLVKADQIPLREKALEILNDSSITGEIKPYHKSMSYIDRAIHYSNDYLFGLSMYSNRIQNCEVTNSENRNGWHQGDGMTYIYNSDIDQYMDNYWNTVNPYRFAGTTVIPVPLGNGTPDSSGYYQDGDYRANEDWAGGTSIGAYGVSGMALTGDIISKSITYAPDLRAKKSYFMFDNEIVCLGSGIQNSGQNTGSLSVETTVENRKLKDDGSNQILVDGNAIQLTPIQSTVKDIAEGTANTQGTNIAGTTWLYLEGNTKGANIGYYFPRQYNNLYIRKAQNTGDWSDIGTTSGIAEKTYMELWFDHGAAPVDDTYEYVILPNMSADEIAQYAVNPKIQILENSPEVQAVYQQELKITGVNFWTDTEQTVQGITSKQKASVMLYENDQDHTLTIAIADPTMVNQNGIDLTIEREALSVISNDNNVNVQIQNGIITVNVTTSNTNGTTSYAVLKLEAGPDPSPSPTPGPTGSPSPSPTPGPTGSPSPSPTPGPTGSPSPSPTPEPTESPSPSPTPGPTESPSPTPIPEPEKQLEDLLNDLSSNPEALEKPEVKQSLKEITGTIQSVPNQEAAENPELLENIWKLEEYIQKAFPNLLNTQVLVNQQLSSHISDDITIKGAALTLPADSTQKTRIVLEIEPGKKPAQVKEEMVIQGNKVKLNLNQSITVQITMNQVTDSNHIIQKNIQPLTPISITMEPPKGITTNRPIYVGHIKPDGTIEWQRASVSNQKITYLITSLSPYIFVNMADSKINHSSSDDSNDDNSALTVPGSWILDGNGWWYKHTNGSWPSNEWQLIDEKWYLFGTDGYMLTGWQLYGNLWYYLEPSGAMLENKWLFYKDSWYWFGNTGKMLENTWVSYNNQWYYLYPGGKMAQNTWLQEGDNWYYIGQDGAWDTSKIYK